MERDNTGSHPVARPNPFRRGGCLSGNGKAGDDGREVQANCHDSHLGRDGIIGCRPTLRVDSWAASATRAGGSVSIVRLLLESSSGATVRAPDSLEISRV